jgi:large subunit ribosomal protein L15
MILSPGTIKPNKGARKKNVKRVGRGTGSGRGTYAGRGLKGQKARSGGRRGLKRLGFKSMLQKVPKLRGFHSKFLRKETVTLMTLERIGEEGKTISPGFLNKKGVISKPGNGVKIVATGELKKKLNIQGCLASKKAIEMIEKAGGTIVF